MLRVWCRDALQRSERASGRKSHRPPQFRPGSLLLRSLPPRALSPWMTSWRCGMGTGAKVWRCGAGCRVVGWCGALVCGGGSHFAADWAYEHLSDEHLAAGARVGGAVSGSRGAGTGPSYGDAGTMDTVQPCASQRSAHGRGPGWCNDVHLAGRLEGSQGGHGLRGRRGADPRRTERRSGRFSPCGASQLCGASGRA